MISFRLWDRRLTRVAIPTRIKAGDQFKKEEPYREQAWKKWREKEAKERAMEQAQEVKEQKRLLNIEHKFQVRAGINARKAERSWKQELLHFQKSNLNITPPARLLTTIIDPDVERKRWEGKGELAQQLATEACGYVGFEGLDYDIIDSASEDESLPDNIDPNLFQISHHKKAFFWLY